MDEHHGVMHQPTKGFTVSEPPNRFKAGGAFYIRNKDMKATSNTLSPVKGRPLHSEGCNIYPNLTRADILTPFIMRVRHRILICVLQNIQCQNASRQEYARATVRQLTQTLALLRLP